MVLTPVFVAHEHGVVDDAAVLGLIGDPDIVNRFLDLVRVFFLVGENGVKLLVEERPERVAAELSRSQSQQVGFGRVFELFADADAAARVLEIVVVDVPAAQYGFQITLLAGGHVHVHVGVQGDDQVTVGTVVGDFPDGIHIPVGQLVHPEILLVVTLGDLNVEGLAYRSVVEAGAGDDTLTTECPAAHQFGQVGAGVEPVVEFAQHGISLGVPGDGGFEQPLRDP